MFKAATSNLQYADTTGFGVKKKSGQAATSKQLLP